MRNKGRRVLRWVGRAALTSAARSVTARSCASSALRTPPSTCDVEVLWWGWMLRFGAERSAVFGGSGARFKAFSFA